RAVWGGRANAGGVKGCKRQACPSAVAGRNPATEHTSADWAHLSESSPAIRHPPRSRGNRVGKVLRCRRRNLLGERTKPASAFPSVNAMGRVPSRQKGCDG